MSLGSPSIHAADPVAALRQSNLIKEANALWMKGRHFARSVLERYWVSALKRAVCERCACDIAWNFSGKVRFASAEAGLWNELFSGVRREKMASQLAR